MKKQTKQTTDFEKKPYTKPLTRESQMLPMNIICSSGGSGAKMSASTELYSVAASISFDY